MHLKSPAIFFFFFLRIQFECFTWEIFVNLFKKFRQATNLHILNTYRLWLFNTGICSHDLKFHNRKNVIPAYIVNQPYVVKELCNSKQINVYLQLVKCQVECPCGICKMIICVYGEPQMITIICVTYGQNDFQIRTLIKQLLTKYQIFTNCPKFNIFTKMWPCA